jgi:hypothetical protein
LEAALGYQFSQGPPAFLAFFQGLIREALEVLELVTALVTVIFIDWHGEPPPVLLPPVI